jgi:DNA polymerase III epsilon subunit-like protein
VVLTDLKKDSSDITYMVGTLDPGVSIPGDATRIHGISNADVKGDDRFEEVAESITAFISDRPLLGFNVSFDKAFLNAELKRHGFETFHQKRSYCVMEALHEAWGYRPSLENALERLSHYGRGGQLGRVSNDTLDKNEFIVGTNEYRFKKHNPLYDAYATAALAATLQRIPINELENAPGDIWEEPPPTQKQLDYIRDLGGDPSLVETKRQASETIDSLLDD